MRNILLAVAVLGLLTLPSVGVAQTLLETDPGNSVRTRADLERLVEFYDEVLASPAYSDRVKREASSSIERVRARLRNGDFRVGDRIVLSVQGEPQLPDTVAVESGPKIVLPLFGEIPLDGVLRSEIEEHLTRELGEFIRDPVVRAQGLMRLSIQGQVGSPGFYVVPAESLVTDALMVAGGPGGSADLESLRIERGSERLIGGDQLREAMREGRTLDQLNLQAGDQIVLPEETSSVWGTIGRVMLGAVPGALLAVLIGRR
ncbi:MAG: polysaccharide biosynthesis/export family protein [Gemmatimonadota bacterium]|nr:polysaccharide biosynthesis/export family protein [Gemmatimonadota bacterium]